MQRQLLFPPAQKPSAIAPSAIQEKAGVVYTKPWVVDLILDLARYDSKNDLVGALAIEPATGEGAFLLPMALRLITSCRRQQRSLLDCKESLIAYELEAESAQQAHLALTKMLLEAEVPKKEAEALADSWIRIGDYLVESGGLPSANFVLGNPPYIRLEDIPADTAAMYRASFATMTGRADLYVAFFQAALSQLATGGVNVFICADRWMLNQYGGELRRLVTASFGVEAVLGMHHADPFLSDVSAYPAITVLRKGKQGPAVVANISSEAEGTSSILAGTLKRIASGQPTSLPSGVVAERVTTWFSGDEPWPCMSPRRLTLLKHLEKSFLPLESDETQTRVGIGVATGADKVFITRDSSLVEASRLIPLAMPSDIATGTFEWSGHYLVSPWTDQGLVDLKDYPRLKDYFERHQQALQKRHVAQKNPNTWIRTIDRVNVPLTQKPKLYIADIKERLNPVFDRGETYPHHNLYFVVSDVWDLEVLGGLLMSDLGQFFVECYGVRMRGGYLRFQAQYLRRIRVPNPQDISEQQAKRLTQAFRDRDVAAATAVTFEIYGIESIPSETRNGS